MQCIFLKCDQYLLAIQSLLTFEYTSAHVYLCSEITGNMPQLRVACI